MANTYLEDRALRALDNLSALNTLANPQEPNYWEKLKHQYAGMAMQGILSHMGCTVAPDWVAEEAEAYATALVEKLKN